MKTIMLLFLATVTIAKAQSTEWTPTINLDSHAKRKLVERAVTLNVGDSFQKVSNSFGKPSAERSWPSGERQLDYYARFWRDANDPLAQFVRVLLDKDGKIESVKIKVTFGEDF